MTPLMIRMNVLVLIKMQYNTVSDMNDNNEIQSSTYKDNITRINYQKWKGKSINKENKTQLIPRESVISGKLEMKGMKPNSIENVLMWRKSKYN